MSVCGECYYIVKWLKIVKYENMYKVKIYVKNIFNVMKCCVVEKYFVERS